MPQVLQNRCRIACLLNRYSVRSSSPRSGPEALARREGEPRAEAAAARAVADHRLRDLDVDLEGDGAALARAAVMLDAHSRRPHHRGAEADGAGAGEGSATLRGSARARSAPRCRCDVEAHAPRRRAVEGRARIRLGEMIVRADCTGRSPVLATSRVTASRSAFRVISPSARKYPPGIAAASTARRPRQRPAQAARAPAAPAPCGCRCGPEWASAAVGASRAMAIRLRGAVLPSPVSVGRARLTRSIARLKRRVRRTGRQTRVAHADRAALRVA